MVLSSNCVSETANHKDFLYLRGAFDVGVCTSTANRFAELTPSFFTSDHVGADRVVCAEIGRSFHDLDLDALRRTVAEFNTLKPKSARNISRRVALASHIRLLMELYTGHIRDARRDHREVTEAIPRNVRCAFQDRARGDEVSKEQLSAVVKHLQVSPRKALAAMDDYITEARKTLWVEDILSSNQ
jgi:hypothetical protein